MERLMDILDVTADQQFIDDLWLFLYSFLMQVQQSLYPNNELQKK